MTKRQQTVRSRWYWHHNQSIRGSSGPRRHTGRRHPEKFPSKMYLPFPWFYTRLRNSRHASRRQVQCLLSSRMNTFRPSLKFRSAARSHPRSIAPMRMAKIFNRHRQFARQSRRYNLLSAPIMTPAR